MSYWGGAWNSLKFSAGSTANSMMSGVSLRYRQGIDGNLIFKNNRAHKVILVQVAKRIAMQMIEGEVNKLFPRYQRYLEGKLRDTVLKQQTANYKQLIKDGESVVKDFGAILTSEGKRIVAKDKYGNAVPESLMLHYESENKMTVTDTIKIGETLQEQTYQTSTLCFIDLVPKVAMNSSKNLILTPVQGRDYTRKELVSGGDLTFTVSGEINSNRADVYPDTAVKKFIQLAQYGGVIQVNHMMFSQFNINQVIIKDYSLQTPEFKNIQPYSFTCVAVEPDEDVVVMKDTIAVLNQELTLSPMNKWYKLILNSKLTEMVANAATSTVSSAAHSGLDALVPNI